MPGESSISFKAYIMDGPEHKEVRRFEVDQGVVTNFDYIRERLQYIFPSLRGKTFTILWKDSEGDEVTISSDEEMMIALSELKTDLCKLIIRLPEEEMGPNDIHIGFAMPSCPAMATMCPAMAEMEDSTNCRSCQKPMEGFRYKCLECLDFYQCCDCEAKGIHSDHVMLRLSQNYPNLMSMIPKGLHILKYLMKSSSKCVGKAAHDHWRRFECGRGSFGEKCKRRSKRYGRHCKSEEKTQEKSQEKCQGGACPRGEPKDCPGGSCPKEAPKDGGDFVYGEIDKLVRGFLQMFPNQSTQKPEAPMETGESSQDEDLGCEFVDVPAEPVKIQKDDPKPDSAAPGNTKTSPQIAQAVQVLTEMGFPNEGQWLAKILERFDGDIAKALDHLTQVPK